MKRILFNLTAAAVMLGFAFNSQAQCPNNNTQYGSSSAASWSAGVWNTLSFCMYGGEYRYVYGLTSGSSYSFQTCGDSDFDTQITVYDAITGSVVAYNDDFCGLQSQVTFTSNGNPVRVLIDRYYCANQSSCMTLQGRFNGGGASDPCDDVSNFATCGTTQSFSLDGSGSWNNLGGPWGTPGEEAVYSFTPTVSGDYTVNVTNSGYYVDLYYKTGSCSSSGWTYVDDIYTSGSYSITMNAGTTYYLLIDDENTSASNGTISLVCPPTTTPCDEIIDLPDCGSSASFSLNGSGSWNNLGGPWATPGQEQVYTFTATVTGTHSVSVTNSGYYVDLYYKTGSCSSSGWTYVDDVYTSGTYAIAMTAGTTYYLLIDDENTSASNGTITVECPSSIDPCEDIVDMTCGVSYNYTLASGSGAWNPPGPWGTPGNEAVFTYTPPYTGSYLLSVTHGGGYYADVFYGFDCSETAWTYISDIFSATNVTFFQLTAGVTYYFLLDDENTSQSTGTISISCPCIPPPGGIDDSITVTSNTTYSGTTDGACNDCTLRTSQDMIIEVNITCPGTYTFSTCGNATWDTYLYLTTQPCGGSVIAFNDDACGLRSSFTTTLGVGTYYLAVEGWNSFSFGDFAVDITKACDLTLSFDADVQGCGYNISCNGGSDGSVTAVTNGCDVSYAWSNGASSATNSGLSTGYYAVSVSDSYGCSADGGIYLTEPTPLDVYAGQDQTVYYGYDPMSCADLDASASGGCGPYSYQWSDGSDNTSSTTVCPTSSTVYTMTVTDANGCESTDDVNVCVIDVRCWAGNSDNQKVQVCHNYGANNPHTICVDDDAVPAHLAHGDALGSCDEVNSCGPVSTAISVQGHDHNAEIMHELELFPNPTNDLINILFDAELESVSYSIVNALGQTVSVGEVSKDKASIDVSSFESGVYYFNGEGHLPVIFVKK